MKDALSVLKRWIALDAALSRCNLYVRPFAERNKVAYRTVMRDLEAFEQLGQRVGAGEFSEELRSVRFGYLKGVQPLFLCNGGLVNEAVQASLIDRRQAGVKDQRACVNRRYMVD